MATYEVEVITMELTPDCFRNKVLPADPVRKDFNYAIQRYFETTCFIPYKKSYDTRNASKAAFDEFVAALSKPKLIGRRNPFWHIDMVFWKIVDGNGDRIILSSKSSLDKMKRKPITNEALKKRKAVRIPLDINPSDNPKLLEWLNQQENRSGYIKSLILADMEKKS